ncbi:hypothetical protein GCM10028809_14470 [Spirosoma gilvum]
MADTNDSLLANVCAYDLAVIHRQLVQISRAIDYKLVEQVIVDKEFGRKRLEATLQTLTPKPNDILVFYYTGHGYNLSKRTDRFPILMLEKAGAEARQNPALLSIHTLLAQKKARLCITLGDCCNNLVSLTRGMVNKRISPKALVLTNDSLNAAYRKLFLHTTGDVLIASSVPPQQACAHPDSGSFYTRAFDEALDIASRYNRTITWGSLLRDTQTRLVRHAATRTKQSMYAVNITPTDGSGSLAADQITPTSATVSFDQINAYLNKLADEYLPDAQRYSLINNPTLYFSPDARIDIYVNTTRVDVQPVEQFVRRLYLNASLIHRINLIERLSEETPDRKRYKRAAVQEIW